MMVRVRLFECAFLGGIGGFAVGEFVFTCRRKRRRLMVRAPSEACIIPPLTRGVPSETRLTEMKAGRPGGRGGDAYVPMKSLRVRRIRIGEIRCYEGGCIAYVCNGRPEGFIWYG